MEREQDFDNEIEIDLKDLFLEIISYWKWIILATIATGAVAFAVSRFMITPMYESTSELYVLSKSTSITSLADIQTGTSLTNDYIVVVKGRPVLDKVIENLGLNENYKTLGSRVTIDNPSNSRVLNITVTDPNPQMAKTIADEIAKVAASYIAEKMKQDSPTIIQSGYDDGGAVSPNIGKNTVLGAFAGAFISIAVIVVTYLFNDTIIDTEDVEKKLGMNVLGTLPLDAAIIDLLMAGAMIGEGTSYPDLVHTTELTSEKYGVGCRKGSDLASYINSVLAESYADGSAQEIAKKYGVQDSLLEQEPCEFKQSESDSDVDYIKSQGKLIVGITEFEPMDYKDKDDKWIGFDADMARLVGEKLGVDVEFVVIDWDNKVMELDSKKIDVVWNGMTLTDEVTKSMECTNAYCNNAQVVVEREK